MRRLLICISFSMLYLPAVLRGQVFTFECFCGQISGANCDICIQSKIQSRSFSGVLVFKNGTAYKWIDAPYTVRLFNGNQFQLLEQIPNGDQITVPLGQTIYTTLAEAADSLRCQCNQQSGGGGEGCGCCDPLVFFTDDDEAKLNGVNLGQYYLLDDDNTYGMAWGLVKTVTESGGFVSAQPPGCVANDPDEPLDFFESDDAAKTSGLAIGEYYLLATGNLYGMAAGLIKQVVEP